MIIFDVPVPFGLIANSIDDDLVWNHIIQDERIQIVSDDRDADNCEFEIRMITNTQTRTTIYRVRANYRDPELELLRRFVLV